ncbi:MAG: ATP-binding protein [Pseudomonadota bacterium]
MKTGPLSRAKRWIAGGDGSVRSPHDPARRTDIAFSKAVNVSEAELVDGPANGPVNSPGDDPAKSPTGTAKQMSRRFLASQAAVVLVAFGVLWLFLQADLGGIEGIVGALCGLAAGLMVSTLFADRAVERLKARGEDWARAAVLEETAVKELLVPLVQPSTPSEPWFDVIQHIPAAFLLLDRSKRVLLVSSDAATMVGEKALGRHLAASLRASDLMRAIDKAEATGEPTSCAFSFRRQSDRHFEARIGVIEYEEQRGEADRRPRYVLLFEDHTRIRRAEKLHRDFVSNASHELRTPLSSMSGFVDTLLGPARDDREASDRFLHIMRQQMKRMNDLINDLMSLNRIEMNEYIPPEDVVLIAPLVEHAVEAVKAARVERPQPVVDWQALQDLPPVVGDTGQLTQVFFNLLDNAYKYGSETEPPLIYVDRLDGSATTAVPSFGVVFEDHGPGINPQDLPRLQERFFRAKLPKGRQASGTGLGLAIVKHTLARHRGALRIKSTLGRGSKFTAVLPAAAHAVPAPAEPSASDSLRRASASGKTS